MNVVDDTTEWISATEAERLLGVSRRTVARLASGGVVERKREEGGPWLYSRSDCERYLDTKDNDTGPEQLLSQAYQALNVFIAPAKEFSRMLQEENKLLRERCAQLEARHDELIRAREELLDRKVDRDLAVQHMTQVEDRKERAFKLIETNVGPKLLAAVGGKSAAAGKLLDSLTEDQLTLLMNTDLISDDQKALLKKVLEAKGAKFEETTEGEDDNAA